MKIIGSLTLVILAIMLVKMLYEMTDSIKTTIYILALSIIVTFLLVFSAWCLSI